jgi:hypothetical protein
MSHNEDLRPLRPLHQGRFHFFPVVPGRMEFAEEVRRTILRDRPQVVAVELPSTLESSFLSAIERLPELSIILYSMKGEELIYVPVEITDPFIEAIRSAQEIGAEVFFVDPDVGDRPHLNDLYPDSYAIRRIGWTRYVEQYRACPQPSNPEIRSHAAGIAWKLQSCDPTAEVLVVISLNLLDPVMEAVQVPQDEPLSQTHRDVQVMNLHPDCLVEVLGEFPFLQSVYESRRYGLPSVPESDSDSDATDFIVPRTARHVDQRVPADAVVEAPVDAIPSLATVTSPEQFRFMDRQRLNFRLFAEAEKRYEKSTREKVSHWQRRLFATYSRNLTLIQNGLVSGLFDQTVAARSIVDDNFAWELWALGASHSSQKETSDIETVNISGDELFRHMKRIRLRRRLPRQKARVRPIGLKERKKEKTPGEWADEFRGRGICSYPPEDIVIENYGLFLKKKGKSVLSEERTRTEPFSTSLLDGIDIRETLRNWHEGRLYVRESQKVSGEVGSVVVIFDEDADNHYSWQMTWQGEHTQESDMAFYSTDPYGQVVGPGIVRAEYGGFLMSYPPGRLFDVWHDTDYLYAESKAETLLLAALDYTLERFVVYVAAKPPRSIFRSIAARLGRKIIYIPIGQLSPISLKKIRAVHVLDGHDKRRIAKDYIW